MSATRKYSVSACWRSGRSSWYGASPMPRTLAPASRRRTQNRYQFGGKCGETKTKFMGSGDALRRPQWIGAVCMVRRSRINMFDEVGAPAEGRWSASRRSPGGSGAGRDLHEALDQDGALLEALRRGDGHQSHVTRQQERGQRQARGDVQLPKLRQQRGGKARGRGCCHGGDQHREGRQRSDRPWADGLGEAADVVGQRNMKLSR